MEFFPHQRHTSLREEFDVFSRAILTQSSDEPKQWLVELSTCILLAHDWTDLDAPTRHAITRRLIMAMYRLQVALVRIVTPIRVPAELCQFIRSAPDRALINIVAQTRDRASQNIVDGGAGYPIKTQTPPIPECPPTVP